MIIAVTSPGHSSGHSSHSVTESSHATGVPIYGHSGSSHTEENSNEHNNEIPDYLEIGLFSSFILLILIVLGLVLKAIHDVFTY